MVISPLYTIRETFDRHRGTGWTEYVKWSGLSHVSEVVSLDTLLCPCPLGDVTDEDWRHNVWESNRVDMFRDLAYLLRRSAGTTRANVLAVIDEPKRSSLAWAAPDFAFEGFDLVEDATGVSAVNNCGGWQGELLPTEVGRNGLIPTYECAAAVRSRLLSRFPDDPHADCVLWAVWRRVTIST